MKEKQKMKFATLLTLLVCGSSVIAGDNAIPPADKEAKFGVWTEYIETKKIPAALLKGKGFNGSDSLKVDLSENKRAAIEKLKLNAGKKYRFGAYVKTNNLKFSRCAIVVFNKYWRKQLVTKSIPGSTYGMWIKIEASGVMPESADNMYTFAIYAKDMAKGGELEISAPFVEEINDVPVDNAKKAVAPGGNIIADFTPSHDGQLGLWSRNLDNDDVKIKLLPKGGVDNSDALQVTGSIILGDINLIPGETYRFGAWVRTNNFNAEGSRIVIYNHKWRGDINTKSLPSDTNGQWVLIEGSGEAPKSTSGVYTFIVYNPNKETFEFCKPFIEGVSPKAIAETFPMESYLEKIRRIYPVTPLLTEINARNPQITFGYSCPLPKKTQDYVFKMRLMDSSAKWSDWQEFPVMENAGSKLVWNKAVQAGNGKIQVELAHKADKQRVLFNSYDVIFIEPLPDIPQKRLNNLVVELKNEPLENKEVTFINPRIGWVYIGCDSNATVELDGKDKIITPRPNEKAETMRYLTRGEHRIKISEVTGQGRLIIRTVPEIMLFPLEVHPQRDNNRFFYDLSFYRKYFFHSANLFFLLHGWNPKTEAEGALGKELAERGIRMMGSDGFHEHEWHDTDKMIADMENNFVANSTSGRAVDETAANANAKLLNAYTEAAWHFFHYDKFVYLWMAATKGYLNYPLLHAPLMSGASHIGKGRGKLLMETYVETTPDLKSLKEYYQLVRKHMVMAKKSSPDAPKRMMLIMSGLLANGAWNCNVYPQSDVKYALDYFFHLVATEPEAKDLYGLGCYNFHYTDEEDARWISKLLRHYAVEGKTEMLSPKYGIVYNPGHVENGDFVSGTDGWLLRPAEENSMKPKYHPRYGRYVQRRHGLDINNGNHFLEVVRSAKGANQLEQTFKNFTVGELYSLTFVTTDGSCVENNEKMRTFSFFDAKLEGAEVIDNLSYEFRSAHSQKGPELERFELVTRKIVFRALKPEIKAVFSDWKSAIVPGGEIGAKLWLNFIGCKRYFDE